jgi:hypothetical protein
VGVTLKCIDRCNTASAEDVKMLPMLLAMLVREVEGPQSRATIYSNGGVTLLNGILSKWLDNVQIQLAGVTVLWGIMRFATDVEKKEFAGEFLESCARFKAALNACINEERVCQFVLSSYMYVCVCVCVCMCVCVCVCVCVSVCVTR